MTKLLRTLSLILIILMLFTSVACNTTNDPIAPDGGSTDNNGSSDSTDGSDTGDGGSSGGNAEIDIKLPDMEIPEGYTVLSSNELTLPVTQNGATADHKARLATIKNDSGANALYLDVITENNTVLLTKVWYGYYQLYIDDKGLLFSVNASPSTELSGSISYYSYTISDTKISMTTGTETKYDSPRLIFSGSSQKFNFEHPIQIDACRTNCELLYQSLCQTLIDNTSLYMLADCYLNPSSPTLYSVNDKIPTPTNAERSKYAFAYLQSLFSVN